MSEAGNIQYLNIIPRSDIILLSKFYNYNTNLNKLSFEEIQSNLMNREYIKLTDSVCKILNVNKCDKRILGLLGFIKYRPTEFYNEFNFIKSMKISVDLNIINTESNINSNTESNKVNNILEVYFYKTYKLVITILGLLEKFNGIHNDIDNYLNSSENKELKYSYNGVNMILTNLKKYVDIYITYFKLWKENDKKKEVSRMIQSFWEIELTKQKIIESNSYTEEQKQNSIEELNNKQTELKKYLKQLGGKEALNELQLSIPIVIDDSLINHIRNNLELVYWEQIENDITNKDFKKLKDVLGELKNILSELNKSKSFQNELEETLDIDFFIQRLEHNVVDLDEGLGFNNIFNGWLIMHDSPINDDKNLELKASIEKELIDLIELIDIKINELDNTIEIEKLKTKCISNSLAILFNNYYPRFKKILEIKQKILTSK